MKLPMQKRLAARILKCGKHRVWIDPLRLDEAKEAITKADMRALIADGAVKKKQLLGVSKFWARKRKTQRRKERRKGAGSRKGKKGARLSKKTAWMRKIRLQRKFIKELRAKQIITKQDYRMLYAKTKGGFFRSKAHIKLYINEHGLAKK